MQKMYKLFIKTTQIQQQMACYSCTKSSVSIDLFNLPPLPDARRQSTMQCEIPNDFSGRWEKHMTQQDRQ